ncbi:MAG: amidohydrolase family protein [Saprospiraceae bacterium]|nr:amidohydrolase family protein [Saprospiraceae bacterium]
MKKKIKIALVLTIGFFGFNSVNGQFQNAPIKIVDYHVHIMSPELISNLTFQGFDFQRSQFQIIKDKKEYSNISEISNDNQNAKMVLISVGYAYKNMEGGFSKEEFVKRENNLLSELVKTDPEHLIGFYGINPLEDFAIKEIKRCDEDLKLDGLKLHLQSCNLDLKDSIHLTKLQKVIELVAKRKIPLLIHNNAWDKSFGKEYFKIFKKEILDKIDPLTIIFAHAGDGGGFYQFGYDFLNEFVLYFQQEKERSKHKIYFELSGVAKITKYPTSKTEEDFLKIMKKIGYDKFIFGSDYPVRDSPTYINEFFNLMPIEKDELKKIIERDLFVALKKESR